jgi:phage repressor protein C with HTH and peptisase S24 domain
MFTEMSNATFNNNPFKIVSIHNMHETMKRLYHAALEMREIDGKSNLARYLNESPQTITNWENRGVSKAGMIKAEALVGCSIRWLGYGVGAMHAAASVPSVLIPDESKLHRVPVIGKSMGGLPDRMFTDEGRPINGYDEYAEVYSSDPAAFMVRVDGNSMWPKYAQGDYALIEPGTDPELEDDVLVRTSNGEVMLKRLLSRRGGYMLGSYNEKETYSFALDEIVWMYYVAHPVPSRKIKSRL